jgi:hypothetical protein
MWATYFRNGALTLHHILCTMMKVLRVLNWLHVKTKHKDVFWNRFTRSYKTWHKTWRELEQLN